MVKVWCVEDNYREDTEQIDGAVPWDPSGIGLHSSGPSFPIEPVPTLGYSYRHKI